MLKNQVKEAFEKATDEFLFRRVNDIFVSASKDPNNEYKAATEKACNILNQLLSTATEEQREALMELEAAFNYAELLGDDLCYRQGLKDSKELKKRLRVELGLSSLETYSIMANEQ